MDNFFRRMFGFDQHSAFDNFYGNNDKFDDSQDPISSMQSFINDQINDILGHLNLGTGFPDEIIDTNPQYLGQSSLRQSVLKPGFQDTCQAKPNADVDLDDRARQGNLKTLLEDKNTPPVRHEAVFSKSYITRTVRQPDGTYVTEKITRDQDGNEEKTVIVHKDDDNSSKKGPFGILF